jgi:muramidase (phage lysozyme)
MRGRGTAYQITPERRALLNTIRYAEGTWAGGSQDGYRIMFGGGKFNDLTRHPDKVVHGGRYSSAAAGAYQFMPFTWDGVTKELGLKDFGPTSQDQAAIHLVKRRGALSTFDKGGFTPNVVNSLAPEWASFPTHKGGSFYGQPNKKFDDLRRFYNEQLELLRGGKGQEQSMATPEPVAATAATAGAPAPVASAPVMSAEDTFNARVTEGLAAGDADPFVRAFGGTPKRRMAGEQMAGLRGLTGLAMA